MCGCQDATPAPACLADPGPTVETPVGRHGFGAGAIEARTDAPASANARRSIVYQRPRRQGPSVGFGIRHTAGDPCNLSAVDSRCLARRFTEPQSAAAWFGNRCGAEVLKRTSTAQSMTAPATPSGVSSGCVRYTRRSSIGPACHHLPDVAGQDHRFGIRFVAASLVTPATTPAGRSDGAPGAALRC